MFVLNTKMNSLIAKFLAFTQTTDSENTSWTTVTVNPPDTSCCEIKGWVTEYCNVIQDAVDNASEYTIIELTGGTYCNENWSSVHQSKPDDFKNQNLLNITNKKNL